MNKLELLKTKTTINKYMELIDTENMAKDLRLEFEFQTKPKTTMSFFWTLVNYQRDSQIQKRQAHWCAA